MQAQREAARSDYNVIDEQRRKKQEKLAKAETELAQTRREIKTDKLKGVAVDATTKAVERIGALFHDPKPARYEKRKYPLIPTLWMIFEDSTFAFRSGDKHRSRRIYGK